MEKKIYFICTDNKEPIGGVKQLYRQVDILNKNGFTAFIIHRKKGFRHKWFKNETKIIYNRSIYNTIDKILKKKQKPFKLFKNYLRTKNDDPIDDNGILVIPEIYGPYISALNKNIEKVIFNQNCYYTFNKCDIIESKKEVIYLDEKFLASIVVSEDSKKYLEYTFPKSTTHRVHLGINTNKFNYNNTLKKKQIAFMPRKLEDDIIQIINILRIRDNLKNWNFVPIDNKTEDEVATILNESSIFLSLNHKEGFGLPPAEAMASGCIVIGYAGQGGKEYFNPNFSFKIDEGNIIDFVDKIEEISLKLEKNDPEILKITQSASDYISNNYNLKKEEESIVLTWKKILKSN
ncbi:glycosyltransferase [Flavobacterium pectinovorum]|uniref:glycosyltransferase n=1 Tax=Flavobacterium pectinovorum TaxID=29533 RepID=UPI001FAE5F87|nr:glycosyltransferase [Flavobacterium pectinovorum]MCI9844936.1 glycosyltransferase family 4 protein [Flavobacterium pectinovorum]